MIRLFFVRSVKVLMITAPFITLMTMLLALWGVTGKVTYAEFNSTQSKNDLSTVTAKNYLVSDDAKKPGACNSENITQDLNTDPERNDPQTQKKVLREKIDWSRVV